jgi:hypothetical protein
MKYLILLLLATACYAQDIPEYNRKEWKHWIDVDKDCQDTRQEVLIEESVVPVTLDERGCRVLTGKWICPLTGRVITNPKLLDIDHRVPLKEAHMSGGWKWSKEKKQAFANDLSDPNHLEATYRGANRSKGAKDPADWMPKNKYYYCLYLTEWSNIKIKWELLMDEDESEFIINYLERNCKEK